MTGINRPTSHTHRAEDCVYGIAAEGSHDALCETELVAVGLTVSRFQPVARLCGRLIRVKLWGLALMLET